MDKDPASRINTRVATHRSFISLTYLLYNCVAAVVALPLVLFYLVYRGLKDRRYFHRIGERFGRLDPVLHRTMPGAVWLHAVSVGEILSAIPLIKAWRTASPDVPVFVSTSTLAGRAMAEDKLTGLAAGIFFAPLDFRFAVRRVLRAIKPAMVVVMETEIWPNLYRQPKLAGASLVIVNGRISDRTINTYRRTSWFFRSALAQPDLILAQSRQDAARYRELGAPPDRIVEAGNLKFDFNPAGNPIPADLARFFESASPAEVWICASTMPPMVEGDPDEDEAVIEAFQKLSATRPRLLLVLVPRKPERFDVAAQRLASAQLRFTRRTSLQPVELPGVLLLDSMGELSSLFEKADVVFMGGTLARRGGHNILEPASFSKPVIVGPHMENFAAIEALFREAGALVRIDKPGELAPAVEALLASSEKRALIGSRAAKTAAGQRGVAAKVVEHLARHYAVAVPRALHGLFAWLLLWPLSKLWAAFARKPDGARQLPRPVVSLGGITMGGTGKTPMAVWLADKLRSAGYQPAILTRGYGRQSPNKVVIVPAGHAAPVALTGDEAQIFVRRGTAHLGISASRFDAGTLLLERQLSADVFLLDDGFQHRKLHRDTDLVLIDCLDPFGGGDIFPLGRLREPLENLGRASAFVLTRANPGRATAGIESALRRYQPEAPIFRSWVVPSKWRGGTPAGKVAAFCGLANPNTFWKVLDELGLQVEERWTFDDHHKYTCLEATRLADQAQRAGVEFLVTTEKDYMNLPDGAFQAFEKVVRLCWLEVEVRLEDPSAFLEFVINRTLPKLNNSP